MSYQTVLPIWNALRGRFQKTISAIPEDDLHMYLGKTTIGQLLYHTAEVEYLFSEWFFGNPMTETFNHPTDRKGYLRLLEHSNKHFTEAMRALPNQEWNQLKKSPLGRSTPLESVGRLMNHTGIHAGQISYIQKHGQSLR